MNVMVTAGNTLAPIDKVRVITNVFTGKTGANLALHAHSRGHTVTLLTSHPETVPQPPVDRWALLRYTTFDDLHQFMRDLIQSNNYQVVVHCAAVSDYLAAGIFAPTPTTRFDERRCVWEGAPPAMVDRAAGKVKSDEPELWLRLRRAPKLIDRVRADWGFRGILVKFKLEVGAEEERLREIAEMSRCQSAADLMVANTAESAGVWALLGPVAGGYERVLRPSLAQRLFDEIERLAQERGHG
jgi:phosphopantothenoylcysteine synthetase/decarboxylase